MTPFRRPTALPVLRAAVRDDAHPTTDAAADAATTPVTRRGPRLPHQPRRAVQEGLDVGGAARGLPHASAPRSCGAPTARCTRRAGTRRSTTSRRSLRGIRSEHGADAVGVFGGGGLTNEKAYLLGKFARLALGTSRIDYNGRYCMSSAAAAGNRAFGVDRGLPFPLEDLDGASTILLLGTNVAETMPPFIGHLAGAQAAGGLVVVDPRRTATARLTDDGHGAARAARARHRPRAAARPHPHRDRRAARRRATTSPRAPPGSTRCAAASRRGGPNACSPSTGVPALTLRRLARRLAVGRRHVHPHRPRRRAARRRHRHRDRRDQPRAAARPARARRAAATAPSPARATARAAASTARSATSCPATARSSTPRRARTSPGSGASTRARSPAPACRPSSCCSRSGDRAACAPCSCTARTSSSRRRTSTPCATGSRALDLLVVCDFFLSETAALADVVLPITQWAEEEGTMTSLEGRVIRRRRAITPPAGVRDELWILAELARRLECTATFDTDPELVFEELRLASEGGIADYSGHRLRACSTAASAAYWPYPRGSAGTPRLFADRFAHPDGRARLVAVVGARAGAPAPARRRAHAHHRPAARALPERRRRPGGSPELAAAQPEALAAMHPATAERLGIADGDDRRARERARSGALPRARSRADIRPDAVFLPFHYARRAGREPADLRRGRPRSRRCPSSRPTSCATRDRAPRGSRSPRMSRTQDRPRRLRTRRRALRRGAAARRAGRLRRAHRRRRRGRRGVQPRARRGVRGRQHRARRDARRRPRSRRRRPARACSSASPPPRSTAPRGSCSLSTGEELALRPARARDRVPGERADARRRRAAPPRPRLAREVRPAARGARRRPARGHHRAARPRRRRAGARGRARPRAASSCSARACSGSSSPSPPRMPARRCASCTTAPTRCRATSIAAAGRCCGPPCGARASRSSRTAAPRRWRTAPTTTAAAASTCSSRADGKQLRGDLLVLSCGVSPRNELATLAGLRTAVGIVVSPQLQSGRTRRLRDRRLRPGRRAHRGARRASACSRARRRD